MVRRRHGPEPERTRQELERMVQRRAVLRVSYKGSISYRNAARLQPPRRARGGGKAGAPDGVAGGGSSPKQEVQGLGSPAQEQEDVLNPKQGQEEVGSPKDAKIRVQAEESYKHSNFGVLDGGSPKEVKFAGLGGWNPIDDSRGVLGAGPKEGTFGGLGDGTPKDELSWVHGSHKDGTCGMLGMGSPKGPLFGIQGFGAPKDVLFGGKGSGSPKDGKPGEVIPKGTSSWVQDPESPKEVRFGEQGFLEPKNGKLGGRSPNEEKLWMQAELSPREVASGIQGGWCPKDGRLGSIKDGKFGVLGGRSPKEVVSGMQRELSPKDGTLGVQVRATSKDTVSGVVREVGPRDGHLGVQGRRSPNSGSLGVQGDSGLRNWKLGVLEATTPKDGKVAVGEGQITKEVMLGSKDGARWGQVEVNKEGRFGDMVEVAFGVQDRLGIFGEDRCVIQEKAGKLGELGVQDKHVLQEGIRGILDNRSLGLQGTLGILGEGSPKNLSCGIQGDGISKEVDLWEARPRQMGSLSSELQGKGSTKHLEKGIAGFVGRGSRNELEKGRPKEMGMDSAREMTKGLISTEPGVRNENGFIEECQDLLAKGSPRLTPMLEHAEESSESQDSMLGENTPHCHGELKVPKAGAPGLPKHGSPASPDDNLEATGGQVKNLRRVKRGTMGPEEEEPPVKKLRTESPEPGGERSRRSLGAASITEVPLAPTTRSGSRRPLNSAPGPRVERLTRARGRWQQEEERVRPQRSRSRPDRNAGQPQESPGSSSQGGRSTRSKKVDGEQTKEEGEEDVSMLSEGSEVPDAENDTAVNCVEDKSTKTPLDSAEPELDRGTEHPTGQDQCEQDNKMEQSSTNGPLVATDTEQGALVEKSFSSYAAVHHLLETTDNTFSRDKNESMCKTHTGPHNNCEKGCATHLLSIVKNTNGCSTNIGALDKNSSVFDTICPRVKREEGCNTSVCPLGECAVKAVPVETVKLEDDAGEPRDCEASLGIEGVEPHLPIRVSPVTPMVLTMDRTSYKKISANKKPSDPVCWSVMDVVQYFTDAGFAEQASAFQEQEIDGKSLLLMQRTDVLTGLSIRLGPALKMYEHHIKILQQCHFTEESGFLD